MDVGMMMIFSSYGWEDGSDGQMWEEELRLAEIAADAGFDCLWSAEHHFNDYSFVPDNIQLMTHIAAKHPNIDVGTAAVILPWHDPLRVAENAAVLDLLSNGRLRLGFGRGLARREFEVFGISMDESRERFDEAAPMIVNALRTGSSKATGLTTNKLARKSGPVRSIPSTVASTRSPPAKNRFFRPPNWARTSSCSPTAPGKCGCRGSNAAEPCTVSFTARSRQP